MLYNALMQKNIELLAPAKDLQAGIAAITCGADAVYIGAPAFSARQAAGNSIDDIAELVSFAHQYYVKVYVALNTILTDDELSQAEIIIRRLYEKQIDGLIIQDMGLLELDLPPVPLIASTQMNNDTVEKVKFLEDIGFSRVILARELNLDQIRQIREATKIELEFFVHGALCVSASGQCYMSYALGGRSGNRGQCAQPCRRLYSLHDEAGENLCHRRYLLSLKDLNLSDYIGELLDAGICSFKIEGRLKEADYVANITAHYRRIIDGLLPERNLNKSSSGNVTIGFSPDPAKSFNRGFTNYGIDGSREKMGSIDTPKSIGEPVGYVVNVAADCFEIETDLELHNADGICFFDSDNNLQGTILNGIEGKKVFPQKMTGFSKGAFIYRNYDHKFHAFLEKLPAQRKIALKIRLFETPDGIALEAVDEDGNIAIMTNTCEKSTAKNQELARKNLSTQLAKFGNTIFSCDDIKIELAQVYFFPLSQLNHLRRQLIEEISRIRLLNRPVCVQPIARSSVPYPQSSLDYTANVLNAKARQFYHRHGVTKILPAAESGVDMSGKTLMKTKYCIRRQLNLCPGPNNSASAPSLLLIDEDNNRFEVTFDCCACRMQISKG